jgi:hypothetical protein
MGDIGLGKLKLVFIIVSLLIFGADIYAQTLDVPLVLSAKGSGFTVTRKGKLVSYNASQLPQQRIILEQNVLLQTGKSDFVQLALLASDAILSVGENTNIMYTGSIKQDSIKLIYGRIRINSKGLKVVMIEGGDSMVAISGGDGNIDYTILPGVAGAQRPVLRVSSMPGAQANVISVLPKAGNEVYGRIAVNPGETLLLDPVMKTTERVKLDKSIAAYWVPYITQDVLARNSKMPNTPTYYDQPLTTQSGAPIRNNAPPPSLPEMGSPQQQGMTFSTASGPDLTSFGDPDYPSEGDVEVFHSEAMSSPFDYRQSTINLKTGGIIAGFIAMTAGAAMQGIMYFMKDGMDPQTNKLVFTIGYAPIGLGAFTLLAAGLYRTPNENQP